MENHKDSGNLTKLLMLQTPKQQFLTSFVNGDKKPNCQLLFFPEKGGHKTILITDSYTFYKSGQLSFIKAPLQHKRFIPSMNMNDGKPSGLQWVITIPGTSWQLIPILGESQSPNGFQVNFSQLELCRIQECDGESKVQSVVGFYAICRTYLCKHYYFSGIQI